MVTLRRAGDIQIVAAMYRIPAAGDPDYAAVDVLAQVLGTAPTGRLHRALVQKGLASSAWGYERMLRDPGYASFGATVAKREFDFPENGAHSNTFGGNALVLILAGYGTGVLRRQIDVTDPVSHCVVVYAMTCGCFLLYGLLGLVFAEGFLWPGWPAFLFDPLYNCLVVPFAALAVSWVRAR